MKKRVFVISKEGKPLMPCSPARADHLLKNGKAKIVRHEMFAIQLTVSTTEHTQKTTLGIDAGFSHIGFSVVTDKKELVCGTLDQEKEKTSNPTSTRLEKKKMHRRNRRSKLRHRKPRFLNRKSNKKDGWIPPSIERKKFTHINLINRLKKYIPVDKIILEKNKFDIAKLENPDIDGTDYQHGKLFNSNRKAYLTHEQGGKCPICEENLNSGVVHVHHIKPRRVGGSDSLDNLVLLHEHCHETLDHVKWKEYEEIFKKAGFKSRHKPDTCMNIICNKLVEELNPDITYGYITYVKRKELGLSKEHYNDAFVIAGGENQERCIPMTVKQKHRNNRVLQWNNTEKKNVYKRKKRLRKIPLVRYKKKSNAPGYRIRKQRYAFHSGDIVFVKDKRYICGGIQGGRVVIGSKKSKKGTSYNITITQKKITRHIMYGSLIFNENNGANPNITD